MSYQKQIWNSGRAITQGKLNHIEMGVEGINMDYQKTTWRAGDTITAEKLNNIEDGIANAGSGDFSIAEVTFINTQSTSIYTLLGISCLSEDGIKPGIIPIDSNESPDGVTIMFPLYKGKFAFSAEVFDGLSEAVEPTTTGDVSIDFDEGIITVTGDGTFVGAGSRTE